MFIRHVNRLHARRPRWNSGWCDKCDRNYVGGGARCRVCGLRREPMDKVRHSARVQSLGLDTSMK